MKAIDIIRHYRNQKEISQAECAKLLNIAKTTYGDIERGRIQLKADDFLLLCNYLDIDLCQFKVSNDKATFTTTELFEIKENLRQAKKAIEKLSNQFNIK